MDVNFIRRIGEKAVEWKFVWAEAQDA
jgi:hypothetical protein